MERYGLWALVLLMAICVIAEDFRIQELEERAGIIDDATEPLRNYTPAGPSKEAKA
jgi:hypothetical protein